MKWTVEQKIKPKVGDRREVKKFALLPQLTDDHINVWLEHYIEIQEWGKRRMVIVATGIVTSTWDWIRVGRRHICSPDGPSIRGGYSPFAPCMCGQEALSGVKPDKPWPRA
jgi:hypothetical protein